jgi:hypothetical protein
MTVRQPNLSERGRLTASAISLAHPFQSEPRRRLVAWAGVAVHDLSQLPAQLIGQRLDGEEVQRRDGVRGC